MLTLGRVKASRGNAGEPLPTVFQSLAANTVHFRRGNLTLVAAAPGVGKSVLALTEALLSGVPSFYFSADTDAFTMYLRAASMFTGYSTLDVENAVSSGNTAAIEAHMAKVQHVRFDFSGRIEIDAMEEQLAAYTYAYGEWPHLIVVDNISNMDNDDDADGYVALEHSCDYLHELCRVTGAAVIALHHVTGSYDDGITPVPLSGLRGKISKVPEMVLTLSKDEHVGMQGYGTLYVAAVKNRTGRGDPSGNWRIPLHYVPHRMKLEDMPNGESDQD